MSEACRGCETGFCDKIFKFNMSLALITLFIIAPVACLSERNHDKIKAYDNPCPACYCGEDE